MPNTNWIAVDWTARRLRAWAMSGITILDQIQTETGTFGLPGAAFEPALLSAIGDWLDGPCDVVISGDLGAWQDMVLAPVPAVPHDGTLLRLRSSDPRLRLHAIPGLSQAKPADFMLGTETRISGFLTAEPDFDGVLCCPAETSRWVRVSASEVVSFQSFITGELIRQLSPDTTPAIDADIFAQAMDDTLSRPEQLASFIAQTRAETTLSDLDPAQANSRIVGTLIGAELAAARPYWLGQTVVVLGAEPLASLYAMALQRQGVTPAIADGSAMALTGLIAAHARLRPN